MIEVEAATAVDDDLCTAVGRLVPQLSRSAPAPSRAVLERMVGESGTTLFVARLDGSIVGMLTLITFEIPTGVRAWIEDVVVDGTARGAGVAGALVQAAVDRSAAIGARDGRSHVTARTRGGPPPVPAHGLRDAPDQRLPKGPRHRRGLTRAPKPFGPALPQPMATMGALRARPPVDPLKAASP